MSEDFNLFHPVSYQNQTVGYLATIQDCQIFYGNKFLKRADLQKVFPQFEFYFVKQVHGKKIVPATSQIVEADGHLSSEKNKALVVQTADCLPVFLWDSSLICAIHSGWKGVAQKIVLEGLKHFSQNLVKVSVGPHISQEYFEVDLDVAQKLTESVSQGEKFSKKGLHQKFHIDLMGIIQAQLGEQDYYLFNRDTFSEKTFHSFRRTAEKLKGQYSFIVRI